MLELFIVIFFTIILAVPTLRFAHRQQKKIKRDRHTLASNLLKIQSTLEQYRDEEYLEKRWLESYIKDIKKVLKKDKNILKYLNQKRLPDIFSIDKNSTKWIESINRDFTSYELKEYQEYFDTVESNPLTHMQRIAVITHEENNLILAGAGSGKTSVIVAKIGYLLEKEYCTPDEIIILSFNKKAQEELSERIKERIGVEINIKTFHALGKEIVDECYIVESLEFDEMITLATQALIEELYASPYSYIFIDEFQDISQERAELLFELKMQTDANITAVGDDWQSINQFAGSDISIIQNFREQYPYTAVIKLDYTFRFNQEIAQASRKFILKNPAQITKEIKTTKKTETPSLYIYWYKTKEEIEEAIIMILSLIDKKNKETKSVKILSRYRFMLSQTLSQLQEQFPKLELSNETIHSSKGLEADYVIITHLESGKFGFPSEIEESDEPFLYAEERRLFYVAMTRAKEKIFFICNKNNPSIFIEELIEEEKFVVL